MRGEGPSAIEGDTEFTIRCLERFVVKIGHVTLELRDLIVDLNAEFTGDLGLDLAVALDQPFEFGYLRKTARRCLSRSRRPSLGALFYTTICYAARGRVEGGIYPENRRDLLRAFGRLKPFGESDRDQFRAQSGVVDAFEELRVGTARRRALSVEVFDVRPRKGERPFEQPLSIGLCHLTGFVARFTASLLAAAESVH